MCLVCAMENMTTRRHEALDWMRSQVKNIPDLYVLEYAKMVAGLLPIFVRPDKPILTREDAIRLLAGFFYGFKVQGDEMSADFEKAFNAGELRGHAA